MRRQLRIHAPAAILLLLCSWGAPAANACLYRKFSLDEMTRGAAQIVEGRVVASTCAWNADKTQIYTTVTLEVSEFLKGGPAASAADKAAGVTSKLDIRLLGGEVDDVGLLIVGAPQFRIDQNVFLFLSPRPESGYPVYGMREGFFEVTRDSTLGDPLLRGESMSIARADMLTQIHSVLAPLAGAPLSK